MSSIPKNNRAAALLLELREEDHLSIERLALLIGVTPADLRACQQHTKALPALAQVRLAQAIAARVPRLAGRARHLENQALAAASMEVGTTALHLVAPAKWWGR
jgi:hypothetical protein